MEHNVGSTDAAVRIVVGALLGVASLAILGDYLEAPTILSPILGLTAVIVLGTGVSNTCGLYSALGISTD